MVLKKLGAIWRGKTKEGKTYFNGVVEVVAGLKTKIVMFPFTRKDKTTKENDPAYSVYLQEPFKEKDKGSLGVEEEEIKGD